MRDAAALAEPVSTASAPDAAGPLLDRQLNMLGELAEIGLEIARALESQAKATGPKVTDGDIALAYGRVARAVRQAILLQSRLLDDAKARSAAAGKARAEAREVDAQARAERENLRKCHVSWIVERVVMSGRDDEDEIDRLVQEADERLDDETLLGDVLTRPISDIVADICRDLGLDPDWTRLAEEAWAREELAGGQPGRPLATFATARPPPLAGKVAQRAGGGIPPPPDPAPYSRYARSSRYTDPSGPCQLE